MNKLKLIFGFIIGMSLIPLGMYLWGAEFPVNRSPKLFIVVFESFLFGCIGAVTSFNLRKTQ